MLYFLFNCSDSPDGNTFPARQPRTSHMPPLPADCGYPDSAQGRPDDVGHLRRPHHIWVKSENTQYSHNILISFWSCFPTLKMTFLFCFPISGVFSAAVYHSVWTPARMWSITVHLATKSSVFTSGYKMLQIGNVMLIMTFKWGKCNGSSKHCKG